VPGALGDLANIGARRGGCKDWDAMVLIDDEDNQRGSKLNGSLCDC
jgi:hypothetical protein